MELDILAALAASKPPEPEETDVKHLPQDKRLNNGWSYITDDIFKTYLEKFGCDKETIKDCFDYYDVGDRWFLLDYFEGIKE